MTGERDRERKKERTFEKERCQNKLCGRDKKRKTERVRVRERETRGKENRRGVNRGRGEEERRRGPRHIQLCSECVTVCYQMDAQGR